MTRYIGTWTWLVFLPSWLCAQGYSPAEAPRRMVLADGLHVQLFASEPEIRQPIFVKCDDRGRLWTIQYLQYPNPAGLKRVQVDRWSRTVYDRVPEPPPRGPRGADRITICEDTNDDGKADHFKDFVAGLNLCTGLEFGTDGVYVLQAPYLLFYPDRNRDDVPDGDPEVLLSGFGMEDAQSLANHLTWGPDGWLYGLNGSTTTCRIQGIEFQQGVWRYHPKTREFELFCEGGGNVYGLTFDALGNLFYSSNLGLCWHAHQGAYYFKNLGKHGPLHNPYAYGWLMHVNHNAPTGGPSTGGTIYRGHTFPERFHGRLLVGDFLRHTASTWDLVRNGSTYDAQFREMLADSKDTWFGATDLCLAPDGAVFLSDFHDKRTAHPDPDADWDRSNGRIYRIQARDAEMSAKIDMSKQTSAERVSLLKHPNGWFADRARLWLVERKDVSIVPKLQQMTRQTADVHSSLQALWTLHGLGALDHSLAKQLLRHPSETVRAWVIRLLGDSRQSLPEFAMLAAADSSAVVRAQLACTSRRLKSEQAWPIVEKLLTRSEDATNPVNSWLVWWALQDLAMTEQKQILADFTTDERQSLPLVQANLGRLIRRYASEGTQAGYRLARELLQVTSERQQLTLLAELDRGLSERSQGLRGVEQGGLFDNLARPSVEVREPKRSESPSADWVDWVEGIWKAHPTHDAATRLALRVDVKSARKQVHTDLGDTSLPRELRLQRLRQLQEFTGADSLDTALSLLSSRDAEIQALALPVLGKIGGDKPGQAILKAYATMPPVNRQRARDLLFSRKDWARRFLEEVTHLRIASADVPLEQVRLLAFLQDPEIDALVRKHWGNIQPGSSEEKLAEIRRFSNDLRAGSGDRERGKLLFARHCGTCHKLFAEGGNVGPDLTTSSRADRTWLLASIVDPSSVIRSQYVQFALTQADGSVRTGLIAEQDAGAITLLDAKGERLRIPRDQIESVKELSLSIMPEKLLDPLTPQERRDLFAYLQSSGK